MKIRTVQMRNYSKINNIVGWIIFLLATIVYLLTIEPTASWWDCGEYIATAYKLQVGHPPGAPLFQMLGRVFSLLAFGDTSKVALMINIMSALCSSFTILFLFWTITALAKKVVLATKQTIDSSSILVIMGSGIIGALAYTFSDSFWFSAAEGEVYAMSSFFTALTFWAIFKWEEVSDDPHGNRWLLFIIYLIGLSLGVHLLNLLAIPAVAIVYYSKKYPFTLKGVCVAFFISLVFVGFILYALVPDVVNLFAKTELFFVNSLRLPFNSGTLFFAILCILSLTIGILYTMKDESKPIYKQLTLILSGILALTIIASASSVGNFFLRLVIISSIGIGIYFIRNQKPLLNMILLGITFILIGYSSFTMIIIRSNANPPIDENSPENAVSLLSYLNREQYGSRPLVYGQYYNSPVKQHGDLSPYYEKDIAKKRYVITDTRQGTVPIYDSEFTTLFPRMWSNQNPDHIKGYTYWADIKGKPIPYFDGETSKTIYKPTFGENLKFFFKYQIGHMYMRYFLWNFAGRQNNIEGHGEIQNGNWISGFSFLDNARLGSQDNLPRSMENPANNKFYFLPLIFGLIGMLYHVRKKPEDALSVIILFIMTGIAIVVYLNQYPYQPRERDYAYAGSFYAFCIWIGLSVMWLSNILQSLLKKPALSAITATLLLLILVPTIMAKEGWDDHNRVGKYATRDFANNYLNSCDENAIIFTFGDNDTFPLWYAQDVEGSRLDIRVINHMLAGGHWYIHQMYAKYYDGNPIPLSIPKEGYNRGTNDGIFVYPKGNIKEAVELKTIIDFIKSDDPSTKIKLRNGTEYNYIPTNKIKITIDKDQIIKNKAVPEYMYDKIVPEIEWTINSSILGKNDLMVLDLIATNNWERPIYTTSFNSLGKVLPLDKFFHLEGHAYKFMPVYAEDYYPGMGGIHKEKTYDLYLNTFKWGNLNDPKVVIDRESMRNSLFPKNNFIRLAESLIADNKKMEAVTIADKCLEQFPFEKFPPDVFMSPLAKIYYDSGEMTKGDQISEEIASYFSENLDYILSLNPKFILFYENEIRKNFSGLHSLASAARDHNRNEIYEKLNNLLNEKMQHINLKIL